MRWCSEACRDVSLTAKSYVAVVLLLGRWLSTISVAAAVFGVGVCSCSCRWRHAPLHAKFNTGWLPGELLLVSSASCCYSRGSKGSLSEEQEAEQITPC
jgi:hypothetical protein